jgi:multiple sugar transport system substrate-binding protein
MKLRIIAVFFLLVSVLFLGGCGCKDSNPRKYNLSLEIWGTLDQSEVLEEIFQNYRKINPNISTITYKKIARDTYKKELLEGLASGQGPDIFLVNNTWLTSFKDKIVEAPVAADPKIINEQKFRNNFVDVVATDFLEEGKIYATPLSVDSLGLYYNKDLFNQAGITNPPRNWNEFIEDVRKLTKVNSFGEIVQSGAAIGTAYNINRSTDILNLLMLQNGTKMTDDRGRSTFETSVSQGEKSVTPGENALNFYTQFANSGSLNYSWNPNMHYSTDAFATGLTAMMFNYSWHLKTVSDKAPKLNFAIAPVPQFEGSERVNFANYGAFAVAKNKIPKSDPYGNMPAVSVSNEIRVAEAWLFLTYLTTKPDGTFTATPTGSSTGQVVSNTFDPAKTYLLRSGEPSARRDLIEEQRTDPKIGVFAVDNLIAKSWRMSQPDAVESIFAEMIDRVNKGQATVFEALQTASRRVQMLEVNSF